MKKMNAAGDNTPVVLESVQSSHGNGVRCGVMHEIERTLGMVPGFFKVLPETQLEGEWTDFKDLQLSLTTALAPKVKELIGLAVAAALSSRYCTGFHTVAASMNGATAEEINEALLMSKQTSGWSRSMNALPYDEEQLLSEMKQFQEHLSKVRQQELQEASRRRDTPRV